MNTRGGARFRLIFALVALAGCQQDYSIVPSATLVSGNGGNSGAGGGPNGDNPPVGSTAHVFKTIKPAIATRATGCLFCHATVRSNIITDFGFGDSYFLDPANGRNASPSYYFNFNLDTWQSASITGSIIVPKVKLDHSYKQMNAVDPGSKYDSLSLAEFIQMPVVADMERNTINKPAMTIGVSSPTGQKVIEKSKVYIGAPSSSEILALAPELGPKTVGFTAIKVDGMSYDNSKPLSGLEVVDQKYVANKNSEPFVCAGDIVIKGPLFLKSANIVTDNNGCRLYVSGGVFIQGAVNFNGMSASDTKNLQITSSLAIMLGFDPTSVGRRLSLSGDRAWVLPYIYTRGAGTNQEKNQAILDEANKISGLVDAGDSSTTNEIAFSRMVLNAPHVHSRYTGEFKGCLIGEIVLFRLGSFSFSFDPVLEKVPVFPALKSDVLQLKD